MARLRCLPLLYYYYAQFTKLCVSHYRQQHNMFRNSTTRGTGDNHTCPSSPVYMVAIALQTVHCVRIFASITVLKSNVVFGRLLAVPRSYSGGVKEASPMISSKTHSPAPS
jgi:hypothetical protein